MSLGRGSYANTEIPDRIKVGNFSSIASGVKMLVPGDNHTCVINKKSVYSTNWNQRDDDKWTEIGNDVWIGYNVMVLPGVKIGDGAIIGAGAVVAKDIPPYAVAVGNPAQVVKYRFNKKQIKTLLKMKWWDLKDEIMERLKHDGYMDDVDKLITFYKKQGFNFV